MTNLQPAPNHGVDAAKMAQARGIISEITPREREALETLFRDLLNYGAGYTLFGGKPCSTVEYFKGDKESFLMAGLAAWEACQNRFPMTGVSFSHDLSNRSLRFGLVRSKELESITNEHFSFIAQYFPSASSASALRMHLSDPHSNMNLFGAPIALHGLILGYGKINSLSFSRVQNLNKQGAMREFENAELKSELTGAGLLKQKTFSSEKEEMAFLKNILKWFSEDAWINYSEKLSVRSSSALNLPRFAAIPDHPETQRICSELLATREVIHKICEQPTILADVFARLL